MRGQRTVLFLTALAVLRGPALAQEPPRPFESDPSIDCSACAEWNTPQQPFRVVGNTWSVGPAGLSAVLVTSSAGHVLLDGALPQSAAGIDAAIRKLGFRTEDVRLILSSHAHYDHAGGIAALARRSGAVVTASAAGARALERGEPTEDDPQFGLPRQEKVFPAVPRVRVVANGETLRVGDVAITAHHTPGHTPGATTWTWRSCEAGRCFDVVYADSLNAVSAQGFRFSGGDGRPSIVASFKKSLQTVADLPCDILLAVHPGFSRMNDALRQRATTPGAGPVVDEGACRAYADDARRRFQLRLAEEAGALPPR